MGSPDLGDDFHSDYESGSPRSQTGDASFFRKYGIDLERRLVVLLSNMNICLLLQLNMFVSHAESVLGTSG